MHTRLANSESLTFGQSAFICLLIPLLFGAMISILVLCVVASLTKQRNPALT